MVPFQILTFDLVAVAVDVDRKNKSSFLKAAISLFLNSSLLFNKIKHTAMHNGFDDVSNSDKFLFRLSALANTQGFKLKITTLGRTDYTAGKVVKVKTFRVETVDDKSNDMTDPTYSGNYLIAAINHNINGESKHTCTMELIKDSLSTGIGELA